MTLAAALAASTSRLRGRSDSPRLDATRLLAALVGHDAAWLLAHGDLALAPEVAERFEAALARRERGEPVAYIVGEAWFFGLRFAVTPDVLVPRPESERLVELARDAFAALPAPRLCDVGTGSGALAIALALALPRARLVATDVSAAALAVAQANANAHGVAARIAFALGDALAAVSPAARFDGIVANLPYVASAELPPAPDPTSFEPRLALDGGPDGLDLYRRLLARAGRVLVTDAALFLEAGRETTDRLAALTRQAFPGAVVRVERDAAGWPRIVDLRRGRLAVARSRAQ